MKQYLFLLITLSTFQINLLNAQENISYVWEFADRNGQTSELTISITDEFEEAMQTSGCCKILQRRNYSRLFEQKSSEIAIQGLQSLPKEYVERLKALQAESVVFGEVYDDTNSGQFKISVSVESFNGEILKKASTYMAKFEIHNPQKRIEAIATIIDKLDFKTRTTVIETKEIDEWIFSLAGCARIGKDVECGYTVTSNYRDRRFTIYTETRAFDEFGYEYSRPSMKLANKNVGYGADLYKVQLVDGILTSGSIRFKDISSRANKFSLLEFRIKGDDLSEEKFQFRDVVFD